MPITAMHHTSLIVENTGRALAFYHDLLGLPLAERPDLNFPGAWLSVGEQQIHLLELPNPDPSTGRPDHVGRDRHLAMSVTNLNELVEKLEEHGIPMTHSRSGRDAVFCRDPDGNGVELIGV